MPAIRDPIHDWIKCSDSEMKVVNSPLFQRLHWVGQLTSVKQVFPGGVHTRFLHSLGVMKLAGQYMSHLLETLSTQRSFKLGPELQTKYYQLARMAGLLHDIGHGPFSHAFDRAIYSEIYGVRDGGHDFHRFKMVKSDYLKPLLLGCGVTPSDLIAVWNSQTSEYRESNKEDQNWYDIIRAIIQGPLGADRMDFTMRDSYFTGTAHLGTIASTRIISNTKLLLINEINTETSIQETNPVIRIHYNFKCISDIIQALSGRYYMYDSVYLHKTSSAANILIEKMLHASSAYLGLKEQTDNLEEFQWLNDDTIIGAIMAYKGNDEGMLEAKRNCKLLLHRKLPKLKEEIIVPSNEEFDEAYYLENYSAKLGIPKRNLEVIRTRSIFGIDPIKFDSHHLYFWTNSKKNGYSHSSMSSTEKDNCSYTGSMTCREALHRIKYIVPQESHYLVRVYYLNHED